MTGPGYWSVLEESEAGLTRTPRPAHFSHATAIRGWTHPLPEQSPQELVEYTPDAETDPPPPSLFPNIPPQLWQFTRPAPLQLAHSK